MTVAIIDYGAGNIRSIENAFKKLGAKTRVSNNPADLKYCSHIVLPGVGAFGDAMNKLGLFKESLIEKISEGTPFLGLCLGIQVIFTGSDESPGVDGLGIFSGSCRMFPKNLKVPHMGWNTIKKKKETPLLEGIESGSFFYFVHSYYPLPKNPSVIACETDYGSVRFPSVVSEGNVHATQFHPEKSGEQGLKILGNFLKLSK